jgi:hypothetical protein
MHDHLQLRDSVGISPTSLPRGTFDLTAFACDPPGKFADGIYCGAMPETPKRSLGETIGQLLVIIILIGVLIGAIILLKDFIDSHSNSQSLSTSTFNRTCCTQLNATVIDHPGDVVHVERLPSGKWRVTHRDSPVTASSTSRDGDATISSLMNSSTE